MRNTVNLLVYTDMPGCNYSTVVRASDAPDRVSNSVPLALESLTQEREVPGLIPGLAIYFCFSFC